MPGLINAFATGLQQFVTAFKKEYRTSDPMPTWRSLSNFNSYSSYRGRLCRYALYWAFYENTAYDGIHAFAETFKSEYSIYKYTRGTYNPAHRLGDIWATHLMGGSLDHEAGDGMQEPTALPIITRNDAIRPALARLWRDSHWQTNKTVYCRLGAVMGDVALRVDDDPVQGRVLLDVVNPMTLKWAQRDHQGNVTSYIIEEPRLDPEWKDSEVNPFFDPVGTHPIVTYTEWCYLDPATGTVHYQTYLNGDPYPWNGVAEAWEVPYGFVPLVLVNHIKALPTDLWGWSEFHAGVTKSVEADDLGSKLHDQIRKVVEGIWFLAGAQPPKTKTKIGGSDPTSDDTEPGRQEMKIIYAGMGATAVPLMFPLDIQFTSMEIQNLLNNLKEDYPELQFDSARVSGDASGKALREARKKAEAKFHERRAVYDAGLVLAQKKAIAIGGWRGYEGYAGFTLESFGNGDLEHRIGNRTVFEVDPLDRAELELANATAAETWNRAGVPVEVTVRRLGWTDMQVADLVRAADAQLMKMQALKLEQMAVPRGGTGPGAGAVRQPRPKRSLPTPQGDTQAAQATPAS